ncbi:hypothetical protein HGRIS_014693 [Hohenbuehelia grisea]|uniref:Glucose-methanol-choline oxidoreductase N-terminal domain-containing protein n=1 Tax=Hohenbuehelia grisea TaxID=104357 RepID=A0ABR3JU97_9AGAR
MLGNLRIPPTTLCAFLDVIANATVSRILWENTAPSSSLVVGAAVEYLLDGQTNVANATGEAIVAAGTLSSPMVLELSGVGNATCRHDFSQCDYTFVQYGILKATDLISPLAEKTLLVSHVLFATSTFLVSNQITTPPLPSQTPRTIFPRRYTPNANFESQFDH